MQHRAQNTEQGTRVSKCILKVQVVRWTLNVLQETVLGMCNTGTAGFQSDSTIYTFTVSLARNRTSHLQCKSFFLEAKHR